ncbi:formate dehydrogenase accessory sulfurtransferase FdhD [Rhodococcus sp. H36-A4]|uniref:formate dehydrogenase accessory sulfurtransferase FdhD n=1 Tax=Rhodococcus sp. H36-A4 TaxID=3004353 RepID=UPI0022AFC1A1|nr:formate dehydrogenase accessory sulfurtransferase FdhD [Rhodococcus sp. H36-A4]MCZ4079047.1 formate dehydrogenase accessory sulfurtransferase FdhD [Rhodococcus sp. H36-A4]
MGRITTRRPVVRLRGRVETTRPDTLVVEEPLEIRVNGTALAVTMRTPGHDVDLVHGFLLTEGVITSRDDIRIARYCDGVDDTGQNTYNVLDIELAEGVAPPEPGVERNFYTTSSCGVCGKGSLEAVRSKTTYSPVVDDVRVKSEVLAMLPDRLRQAQKIFDTTGGLHGAALCDSDGQVLVVREDVGRHNAVDKVLGWATGEGLIPLRGHILMVSARASFELAQKAVMAGVPILAAVSAPSSLAVDLAEESGLTVVGFLRGENMNLYSHTERILR